jgi:hypothetical protein
MGLRRVPDRQPDREHKTDETRDPTSRQEIRSRDAEVRSQDSAMNLGARVQSAGEGSVFAGDACDRVVYDVAGAICLSAV